MSLAELKAFRMYIEVCVCVRPVLDLNHRCFNSALYIAKPTTAKTVAPKLARSQNVELLRSACVTCLLRTAVKTLFFTDCSKSELRRF